MASIYLHSTFSGGLQKTISFSARVTLRPFKDIQGVNLVSIENAYVTFYYSVIVTSLHRFGDFAAFICSWPHPYSTLILGVFPLHQIPHVGVSISA